jgi:hypothetical protein
MSDSYVDSPIGLIAACGVLALAFCLCCVWILCLKMVGQNTPGSNKSISYKKSSVVPIVFQQKLSPSRTNSPPSIRLPSKVSSSFNAVSSNNSPTRQVTLKDRQLHMSNMDEGITKQQMARRMQSVMDDAVRIDVHRQEAKMKAMEATRARRESKEALRKKRGGGDAGDGDVQERKK